jgi:hypothetical protein
MDNAFDYPCALLARAGRIGLVFMSGCAVHLKAECG